MKSIFALATLVGLALAKPLLDSPELAGSADNEERVALATVYSSCKNSKEVALTFDDGPYVYAYDVSKALVAAGAKGTFFFNGNNYECIYDDAEIARVKYVVAHGHQVASHTWAHLDLTSLSFDKIHDEMWKVEQALERIVGLSPAFMRPPYGNYNDLVRQVAKERNQSLVLWDFDSEDSLGASVSTSEKLYASAVAKNPKNMLALNHEPYSTTAHQVLPYAINLLQSKGYKLVTVAECLGLPAYQWTSTPGTKDSSWHC